MLNSLINAIAYPFKISFRVNGPPAKNYLILKDFIVNNSLTLLIDNEEKKIICFRFLVSNLIGGWGMHSTICCFKPLSNNKSYLLFHFKLARNFLWGFILFLSAILIVDIFQAKEWVRLFWIPGMFFIFNFLYYLTSILPAWVKLRLFFKDRLFLQSDIH